MDPILIWVEVVSDGCFSSNDDSIAEIFVATLVLPYNKLLDAVIVGAIMLVPGLPVIFPQLISPVVISLLELKSVPPVEEIVLFEIVILLPAVNTFCFVSNWDWVIPPLEEILLSTSIVIFVLAVNVFC